MQAAGADATMCGGCMVSSAGAGPDGAHLTLTLSAAAEAERSITRESREQRTDLYQSHRS